MLIQTLLSERTEIRASIEAAMRYAGVALSIIIGALIHFDEGAWQRVPHDQRVSHIIVLLFLVMILVTGFGVYVAYLRNRLKNILDRLNTRLSAWGETVEEKHVTSLATYLIVGSIFVLFLIYICNLFVR